MIAGFLGLGFWKLILGWLEVLRFLDGTKAGLNRWFTRGKVDSQIPDSGWNYDGGWVSDSGNIDNIASSSFDGKQIYMYYHFNIIRIT